MIITRAPFRVTLGGGGTDLPAYYEKHGGFIFAAGIDKYMVVSVNRPIVDSLIRLKYSSSETTESLDELRHGIARETLRFMEVPDRIEISSIADVPSGTGLGSSSCYAVALLHALHVLRRDYVSLTALAEEAFDIERNRLGSPVGKQDQYLAAFGGLTVLDIAPDGVVRVRSARVDSAVEEDLNRNMLMFYTGTSRDANNILAEQSSGAAAAKKDVIENMHFIKELGYKILEAVEGGNITDVGRYFHEHWEYKKKISPKMSNPKLDEIYRAARDHGALGGKISGAGGGGFFTFYAENRHAELRGAMIERGLREMRYRFDREGSKVLVDI